ncbi:hypothetical protein [Variovorax guangxiensis]|uniref:hypothetical protein n=1 Tax=Variovorax guangxiensis TaxID=1775474 RepID=UPI00285DB055|nr:hypothetical protein [Variovorax guangxiensis]MDR6859867.1 hypothetical protein [Variovorax guangxiensis]
MTDRKSLEAAKKLVRGGAAGAPPSAEVFVPEIRSNIKWVPSTDPVMDFRPEAAVLLIWRYGVPFKDLEGLHAWLATHEVSLANLCSNLTHNQVVYLGTYLHIDTGEPRYQTMWGLVNESVEQTELLPALQNSSQFFDLVKVLRGYWSRDANATDHRHGLARKYINLNTLQIDSAFWDVTYQSRHEQPVP